MKDDLTYLSQLAKKATKGRWVAVGCVVENENEKYPDICGAGYSTDYMTDDYQVNTDNIEYIAAKAAHKEIFEKWVIAFGETDRGSRARAAKELRRLHARVEELEAFAKEIEQHGILLRTGGAAPHDLKDLSAALADCVELAKGVLK